MNSIQTKPLIRLKIRSKYNYKHLNEMNLLCKYLYDFISQLSSWRFMWINKEIDKMLIWIINNYVSNLITSQKCKGFKR